MPQSFGTPPHARAAATREMRPPSTRTLDLSHPPVGDSTQLNRPPRPRVMIVDEEREVAVQVLYSTVVFRPNQKLDSVKDARLIDIAENNNVRLRAAR